MQAEKFFFALPKIICSGGELRHGSTAMQSIRRNFCVRAQHWTTT